MTLAFGLFLGFVAGLAAGRFSKRGKRGDDARIFAALAEVEEVSAHLEHDRLARAALLLRGVVGGEPAAVRRPREE